MTINFLTSYVFHHHHMRDMMRAIAMLCVTSFILMGCAGKDETVPEADILYIQGQEALSAKRFFTASQIFDSIEQNYPYSEFTPQSILLSAYAQYQRNDYHETFDRLDTYQTNYPASSKIPYVLYLYGLSYYEQISDIERDQGYTKDARDSFNRLISEYPDTIYAQDARVKLLLIEDSLAGKELDIGRYYQKRNLCHAAIGRYKYVIENYQTTAHITESLHRTVECLLSLSLPEEAKIYAAILGHNYPGSYWYNQTWQLLQDYQ